MKNYFAVFILLILSPFSIFSSCNHKEKIAEVETEENIYNLRCEYLVNPEAVDNPAPLLSWQLQSRQKEKKQTAYRILVSSDSLSLQQEDKADFWDSGIIRSSQSTQVKYEGKTLSSRQQLYWKVKIWDEAGQPLSWSGMATWRMGLLQPEDWSARWIGYEEDKNPDVPVTGPAPYFRKVFSIDKPVRKAWIYICGLGFYEMYVNDNILGEHLAPAVTNYDVRPLKNLIYQYDDQSTQRCLYNTFDITPIIKQGKNVLGTILGNGWYNQRDRTVEGYMWYDTPRMIVQLEIEYEDGSTQVIKTDSTWKTTTGPLLHDGIFTGEVYDARLDCNLTEWFMDDYDDSGWTTAMEVRPPTGVLKPQLAPFDEIINLINPEFVKKENDSTYLYTLPATVSGVPSILVKGKAGDKIRFRYISEEGDDYGQSDTYILAGNDKAEKWSPRFTWHTFRSIEVISRNIDMKDLYMVVKTINTAVRRNGGFNCSNELFNKIYRAYIRTQEANFHGSVSSDCPHRERLGYTGDGQVIAESCLLTYDMSRFFRKWLNDMEDARNKKTGYVTHTAPFAGGGGGPAWGSAFVIMPWLYYCYYSDTTLLAQHYGGMKHWVEYLGTRTDNRGIVVREEPNGWCLGDWCTPDNIQIPEPLVNTAYYYHCTQLMSRIATILGKEEDTSSFIRLADKIKGNFNTVFFNPKTNHYWEGRQGSDVFALAFGLVPEENKQQVFNALLEHLDKIDYHFDTGILATPLLLQVLTQFGRADLAYRVMNQREAPGFAYLLDDRNSTLWENWNGEASRCHPMFGSVITWFYRTLAGINFDESEVGMKHILIKPQTVNGLNYCKGSYLSLYGRIRSEWERDNAGNIQLTVEIPTNTTATIYYPNEKGNPVYESGIPVEKVKGIQSVKNEGGQSILEIASGTYTFTINDTFGQAQ